MIVAFEGGCRIGFAEEENGTSYCDTNALHLARGLSFTGRGSQLVNCTLNTFTFLSQKNKKELQTNIELKLMTHMYWGQRGLYRVCLLDIDKK
jgi:hypothetical protein